MSETLPGYSAYTKGSPEPPTPQEVIERQRQALFNARVTVRCLAQYLHDIFSLAGLGEYGWNGRIIDTLRDVERTLTSGLGE